MNTEPARRERDLPAVELPRSGQGPAVRRALALPEGDHRIAAVAARQRGVVSRSQLLAIGLGPGAISHRISRRRLHRVFQGVYLVGHTATVPLALEVAALLLCGPGAVISHVSAARLWGMIEWDEQPTDVHVTVVGRHGPRPPGVQAHRTVRLDPSELASAAGIPLTDPTRTLLDVGAMVPRRELEHAFDAALVRRLTTSAQLRTALERMPNGPGARAIAELLSRNAEPALTRSRAEERLLDLVRSARLPAPRVNARLRGVEVDLLWLDHGLVVEIDGFAFHGTRTAFERDRRRDARLQASGFRVIRVTWRQIVDEPHVTSVTLALALAAGGWNP